MFVQVHVSHMLVLGGVCCEHELFLEFFFRPFFFPSVLVVSIDGLSYCCC